MSEKEILMKLKKCENDIENTTSRYRKNDLNKYKKRLIKELKKVRGTK